MKSYIIIPVALLFLFGFSNHEQIPQTPQYDWCDMIKDTEALQKQVDKLVGNVESIPQRSGFNHIMMNMEQDMLHLHLTSFSGNLRTSLYDMRNVANAPKCP